MEISDYQNGDEQNIVDLFKTAFGKELPEAYYTWRFLENPVNNKMIKLIWEKELLVSHYAVSGTKFLIEDSEVVAVLSGTTMTHPNYSGRGMLSKLAESLYTEVAIERHIKAVYGYPNNNSHYALIKNLKWTDLEQVPMFCIDPRALKTVAADDVFEIQGFTQHHVNAYYEVTRPFRAKTFRSVEFFKWRFTDNPVNDYHALEIVSGEISYYAIVKVIPAFTEQGSFEIDLVELICPPDSAILQKFLSAIAGFFKAYKVVKINMWMPLTDKRHILLERMGFKNELPVIYSCIRVFDELLPVLKDPRSWYYSMSDSDVF